MLLGAFCQRCRPQSLIRASQRSSLFIMSLRSFAPSGCIIMVSSDMESFVDLAWNQNANTLRALGPSIPNTALGLTPEPPLHTLCRKVRAPLTPPSGSSRRDSHAQPHTLPRHSTRSASRGKQQPTPAEVSPTGRVPAHSRTSRPLPRTSRSSSCPHGLLCTLLAKTSRRRGC